MDFNTSENIEACYVIVKEASSLLFYSHIPTAIIALALGILVSIKKPSLVSKLLFYITLSFASWSIIDLVVWFSYDYSTLLMLAWSLYGLIYTSIFVTSLYFIYVYLNEKDLPGKFKITLATLCLPVILFTPTIYNVSGYNNIDCIANEGTYFTNYYLLLSVLIMGWILVLGIFKYRETSDSAIKKQIFLMTLGIELFLTTLFLSIFGITYFLSEGYILDGNYNLEQYGLFGMPVFIAFLAYIIVRFKAFQIKVLGAQALVIALWFALFAILFVNNIAYTRYITLFTLVLIGGLGYILIKGVKKERLQLEKIAALALDLEKSNKRLKELDQQKSEFVSLASHQLRGPLTAIKGYTSLIMEGDMGPITEPVREGVDRIYKSAQSLVSIVNDFLDVSRIEQGRMKYDVTKFDMKDLVTTVVNEFKPVVDEKGLTLSYNIEEGETYMVNADMNKFKQILNNLIDNSIKYTPKGWIKVAINKDEDNKIQIKVSDNGVGMSKETSEHLFEKFSRAKNASQTNVIGTGLGLYVAKEMIKAHRGNIWAESEGEGKGSTFIVEIQGI